MPGLTGLEVVRRVHQRVPHTRAVVLSMHADEVYVIEALRAGAIGYVLKESQAAEYVQAVRDAAAGRRYLSPALSEQLISTYVQQVGAPTTDPYELLTDRERDVLHLAALGLTAQEIVNASNSAPAQSRPIAPACCTSWCCATRPTSSATHSNVELSRSTPDPPRYQASSIVLSHVEIPYLYASHECRSSAMLRWLPNGDRNISMCRSRRGLRSILTLSRSASHGTALSAGVRPQSRAAAAGA
jgi:Response regulator receiver domain